MRRSIRKLTFVTDAPHFGGAERYIVDMCRAAQQRGIMPHIYWTRPPFGRSDVFDLTRQIDFPVTALEPERTNRLAGFLGTFRTMLRQEQPDALVINACGRRRFWMIPWLAWQAEIPSVWVHQMIDGRDHRRFRPKWFGGRMEGLHCWRVPQTLRHRLAATAATAVITLNAEDQDRVVRWHGVSRNHIHVVPHGVDCKTYRLDTHGRDPFREAWGVLDSCPSAAFVVGSAGRLVPGKGIDLLIEATALVRQRGIPIVTLIAGQGPERDKLAHLAHQHGISEAVKFLDFVQDMPLFYSALDVFALCSQTESFGLAIAEAMACECPVVATPTAGAMRQIEHDQNGWQLCGFSPKECADALASLYNHSTARKRMGRQARADVLRQFSIDLTLERTLRALRGRTRDRSRLSWPRMNETPFAHMAAEDVA